MTRRNKTVRAALACLAVLGAAGCHREPAQAPSPAVAPISKEESEMRTVVPLVRELSADDLARPIVVEFEVPARNGGAARTVFIGIRLAAADTTSVAAAADRLSAGNLSADLELQRSEAGELIGLERIQWTADGEAKIVPLASGQASALDRTTADFVTMREAGLVRPDTAYAELQWAFLREAPPGRYRATIRFAGDQGLLLDENAQLLIAFIAKAK